MKRQQRKPARTSLYLSIEMQDMLEAVQIAKGITTRSQVIYQAVHHFYSRYGKSKG